MPDRNPTRSTRLQDGLEERYEEYRDQHDMRDSEALRALIRKGLDDTGPQLTQDDLEAALQQSQREAQIGSWESGVLASAFMLATLAISVAVTTILPIVPSFEGIVTASLLLAAAIGLLAAVQRGTVEQLERRFSRRPAATEPFPGIEVAE